MITLNSNFIVNFKTGDNICCNLATLTLLYKYYEAEDDGGKNLLCKPIVLILAAVCEAVLHDFFFRARVFKKEGIQNVAEKLLKFIMTTRFDEFQAYIKFAKMNKLLGKSDDSIYNDLDNLRELRNRVHIQNDSPGPRDEIEAFTPEEKVKAECVSERLLRIMERDYNRCGDQFVDDFVLPWD